MPAARGDGAAQMEVTGAPNHAGENGWVAREFVILDDHDTFVPCREAVDEFRAQRGINKLMCRADRYRIFWRKAG